MNAKLKDAVMGFIIGDAFGVPYEFQKRNCVVSTDMIGHGTHNQPLGTWSDDSSMMLATLESITKLGKIDPKDIMENYVLWKTGKKFLAGDSVFDIGSQTALAIDYYITYYKFIPENYSAQGNGSLMRILPLAFIDVDTESIDSVNDLTHPNSICRLACRQYVYFIKALYHMNLKDARDAAIVTVEPFNRLSHIENICRDNINSTGWVVDTLEAVFWVLFNSHNYKDAILTAVDLGGDTDTIAALVGAAAGIMYGVPSDWMSKIAKLDKINDLCDAACSSWYYFTFDNGHYVKFYGTYESTRAQMFSEYGDKWAFQYSEDEWKIYPHTEVELKKST